MARPAALLAALLLMGILVGSDCAQKTRRPKDFIVAAYVPEYRFMSVDLFGLGQYATDVVLFSVEPTAKGDLAGTGRLSEPFMKKIKAVQESMKTRISLSVGGGGRSDHFRVIAKSASLRTKFAAALGKFINEKNLDGVDIDWEYPFHTDPSVIPGFRQLLLQIKEKIGKKKVLSVALHVGAEKHFPANFFKACDRVHFMHYDRCMSGPDCKHSTFDDANATSTEAVKHIPANKFMLGIPAYGRKMDSPDVVMTYEELIKKHGEQPKDVNEIDGFFFNGAHLVEKKTRFSDDQNMLGVFFWEAGQDVNVANSMSLIRGAGKEGDMIRSERRTGKKSVGYAQMYDDANVDEVEEAVSGIKNFGVGPDAESLEDLKTVIDAGKDQGTSRFSHLMDDDEEEESQEL